MPGPCTTLGARCRRPCRYPRAVIRTNVSGARRRRPCRSLLRGVTAASHGLTSPALRGAPPPPLPFSMRYTEGLLRLRGLPAPLPWLGGSSDKFLADLVPSRRICKRCLRICKKFMRFNESAKFMSRFGSVTNLQNFYVKNDESAKTPSSGRVQDSQPRAGVKN